MIGSSLPPASVSSTTYWNLLAAGVPASIAREAARLFQDDFGAALPWIGLAPQTGVEHGVSGLQIALMLSPPAMQISHLIRALRPLPRSRFMVALY